MPGSSSSANQTPSNVKTIFFPPGTSKAEMQRQLDIETEKALYEATGTPVSPAQTPTNGVGTIAGKKKNVDGPRRNSGRLSYYYFDSHSQSFHLKEGDKFYREKPLAVGNFAPSSFQSALPLSGKYQPTLCSDGQTYGFNDLITLSSAIRELGDAYENAVHNYQLHRMAHKEYESIMNRRGIKYSNGEQMRMDKEISIDPPPHLPKYMQDILNIEPDPYVICPNAYLRGSSLNMARNTIHINAEDVVIECDSCVIDSPGTHMSYGPFAKNSIIRGITFKGATDTSLIFRHDGAEVAFEDCMW
eukprot:CAMPEP_0204618484 /NCGR_PEP_ID=MMETSP0717-20131115/5113_1 /ASSEMBLY_ACC=CAM_ASM_000666 /TAXON_ID=230516 /ORGANISM="Chaetoceros curvisetus" /LENGTH=301 /DNA_ID=CAMNT_0051632227 /DNA_START=119 /DNA_END=1021 /DNA_ORIENTATION=+